MRSSNLIPPSTIEAAELPILRRGHREYERLANFVQHESDAIKAPLTKISSLLQHKSHSIIHKDVDQPSIAQNNKVHVLKSAALAAVAARPLQPPLLSPPLPPLLQPPPPTPPPPPSPLTTTIPQPLLSNVLVTPPTGKTALVVICFNRPGYLKRTLDGVLKHYRPGVDLFVSQDGQNSGVSAAIINFINRARDLKSLNVEHLVHTNQIRGNGYEKLAQHFGWVLKNMFDHRGYDRVILLEDDMDIAVDFFDYFFTLSPLYDRDDTILAISAFNDNGFKSYVTNPKKIVRSDYFPGLGWMMNKRVWGDLGPKWPTGYWDDWLREPPQRMNRVTLRPESSRSFTFGRKGVSGGEFYDKFLGRIQLNDVQVQWNNQISELNMLANKKAYDAAFNREVNAANVIDLMTARTLVSGNNNSPGNFKVMYHSLEHGSMPSFIKIARQLKIMDSIKANVPRCAYLGVLYIRLSGTNRKLFIVPSNDFRPV